MSTNSKVLISKHQVVTSLVILGVKKFLQQILITSANIILARLLLPEIFGAFAIIHFLTISFGLLTDFGLGPALVQKKQEITTAELRAVFSWIMIASVIFVGVLFFIAPFLNTLYQGKIGETGIFWLRIYGLTVLFDHLAIISISLLQRNLKFKKLAVGEIITTAVTLCSTIFFAAHGLRLGAFVLGEIIGKVVQGFIFWRLASWSIGINFSVKNLKKLIPFGRNYQANTLLNAVNSAVVPGFVGAIAGPKPVAFINWAGGIRQAALAPTEVIEKILFTAGARAQNDKELLKTLIERLLRVSCLLAFPLLAIIAAIAPKFITLIYTQNWLPGLLTLYLSLIEGVLILPKVLLTDILWALGESKTVRNITFYWTMLGWVLTVVLVKIWGFNGAVIASMTVSATFLYLLKIVRKKINFKFWPQVLPYLLYSVITGIITFKLSQFIRINTLFELILFVIFGLGIYSLIVLLGERRKILKDIYYLRLFITNQ